MNLIVCNKDCTHQIDGYCQLQMNAMLGNASTSECCYYTKNDLHHAEQHNSTNQDE